MSLIRQKLHNDIEYLKRSIYRARLRPSSHEESKNKVINILKNKYSSWYYDYVVVEVIEEFSHWIDDVQSQD
jgi:hypothetical protein